MTASSPLPFHAAPAAGFDEPFAMLGECHQRVRRTLALLQRLNEHLQTHGADEPARQAARDVLRYFDMAAPAHHEDEERHVLPLLRRLGAEGRPALAQLADRLHADHERMAAAWGAARPSLAVLAGGQPWPADEAKTCSASWQAFAGLYEEHLVAEDTVAFPAAAEHTGAAARQAMGHEMVQRRGVVPGG